jgi:carbamoyltransferase
MKIFGFSSGTHDSSYCIMEDGKILIHEELERLTRIKECDGDILRFYEENRGSLEEFDIITTFPHGEERFYPITMNKVRELDKQGKVKLVIVGHHQAHAANAFHSSNFDSALVITVDGGGWDINSSGGLFQSNYSAWLANENDLKPIEFSSSFNMGAGWSSLTNQVFKMSGGGPPYGCQAGTVMAMAAFGDKAKYKDIVQDIFTNFDYSRYSNITDSCLFDFAASVQEKTEDFFLSLIENLLQRYPNKNICISGGVALNCVMCGKIHDKFNGLNVYIPPIPYDAGLAVGCCQYVWQNILKNKNNRPIKNSSSYLGNSYFKEDVLSALENTKNCEYSFSNDECVLSHLNEGKIIAVYGGCSESGRRALGNRSILADPRPNDMKDKINKKVKHRKEFRPFAPSILREKVKEWFIHDIDSQYMSFAIKFKPSMGERVPAVNHIDGTARLQTVTVEENEWYYSFIKKWEEVSGVPILLNTSFNDREPIVETPQNAIDCFFKTDIDYLYFRDFGLLVKKIINE